MTDGWNGWKELEHDDDGGRGGGVANMSEAWHNQEHRAEPAQSPGREEQGQASTLNRRGCGVSGPPQQGELPEVVTVEYIQSVEPIQQNRMLNSVALKWIRDQHESPQGVPIVPYVSLTEYHTEGLQIGKLGRDKGEEYWWEHGTQPWLWLHMFKSMKSDDMKTIIGDGIHAIYCAPVEGSYDHKRESAARKSKKPFTQRAALWDFYVIRVDGSVVRFHPNLLNNKISISDGGRDFPMSPPEKGRGQSDGPGTFKRMVAQAYTGPPSTASKPPPADLPNVAPAAPGAKPPAPPPKAHNGPFQ
jgi:hypothetical protein